MAKNTIMTPNNSPKTDINQINTTSAPDADKAATPKMQQAEAAAEVAWEDAKDSNSGVNKKLEKKLEQNGSLSPKDVENQGG